MFGIVTITAIIYMSTASAEMSRSSASFAAAAVRSASARDRTNLQQMLLSANAIALEGFNLTLMACWKRLECWFLHVTLNPIQACV